jgi:transposase
LEISVGTLHATLHESGAAVLPVEEELVEAVPSSGLLHVDETSWRELNTLLWLWVFCSAAKMWSFTGSPVEVQNYWSTY